MKLYNVNNSNVARGSKAVNRHPAILETSGKQPNMQMRYESQAIVN